MYGLLQKDSNLGFFFSSYSNTIVHWGTWLGCTGVTVVADLIASGIPVRYGPTPRWCLMVVWSIFVIVSRTFLMIAGTYRSIVIIIEINWEPGCSKAWSCVDNSNSS
ncbi:hypothetical protein B0J15DRAFT_578997 [Fusarium solani]|uniref:Uncharacterized protein n=1 Tax=Fusarium solani TaxID=169388 RepID=A0A9P9R7Z6_FUSSL|nr:uncharacterized protein B0J15DRAFT_578997 [Fusarium solani]KAH7268688.1 hypothetical protein B0J15DRAFT_578997 [Fusarium solani]